MVKTLVIGTRRYSSWSLRGWLCVRLARIDMRVELVPLAGGGQTTALKGRVPNGCVPFVTDGKEMIWDSLAIAMWCAEKAPSLWPQNAARRAWAYSVTCQMHSGFKAFRAEIPMNLGRDRRYAGVLSDEVKREIAQIDRIFEHGSKGMGTRFLAQDHMGIADAFYAPVIWRLVTFKLLDFLCHASQCYVKRMVDTPLMQEWYEDAMREPQSWQLARFEDIP